MQLKKHNSKTPPERKPRWLRKGIALLTAVATLATGGIIASTAYAGGGSGSEFADEGGTPSRSRDVWWTYKDQALSNPNDVTSGSFGSAATDASVYEAFNEAGIKVDNVGPTKIANARKQAYDECVNGFHQHYTMQAVEFASYFSSRFRKGSNMVIEKDWRALIGNACWSWILFFIPMIPLAIRIATTSYRFDGKDTLTYSHGLITKKEENVDLRRVKRIDASDSPLSGGKLTILDNDGHVMKFKYLKHARQVAEHLRVMVDEASRARGDVQNRIIA